MFRYSSSSRAVAARSICSAASRCRQTASLTTSATFASLSLAGCATTTLLALAFACDATATTIDCKFFARAVQGVEARGAVGAEFCELVEHGLLLPLQTFDLLTGDVVRRDFAVLGRGRA